MVPTSRGNWGAGPGLAHLWGKNGDRISTPIWLSPGDSNDKATGQAGAYSNLTGSSGVMDRASLAPREKPTMYIAVPTSTGHGGDQRRLVVGTSHRLPSREVARVKRFAISVLRVAAEKISAQV
jgi:hypothetical protein